MITKNTLLAAGYHSFPPHKDAYCTGGLQKAVYDANDRLKLYFITVYFWTFPRVTPEVQANNSVSLDVHLYLPGGKTVGVNYFVDKDTTLDEIESFYAKAYDRLGCVPDPHNN